MTDILSPALVTATLSDTSTLKRYGDGRMEYTDADGKVTVEPMPQPIVSRIFEALEGSGISGDFSESGQDFVEAAALGTMLLAVSNGDDGILDEDDEGDSVAAALVALDAMLSASSKLSNALQVVELVLGEVGGADITTFRAGLLDIQTALNGVYEDLEGDTGGDSVAQAITDIAAQVTALGAL